MQRMNSKKLLMIAATLATAALLSGCGRKGALERPVAKPIAGAPQKSQPPETGKPFILDPLL